MSPSMIAELENVRLHYSFEEPSGGAANAPVLILSHALGAGLAMWDRQMSGLGNALRILRYDTRGHGLSSTPKDEYALSDLGRDVLQLMNFLNIEHAHFCGISLGGMTALWLGIHAPDRVQSIIAADAAARIGTRASWKERMQMVRDGGMLSIADGTLERWYTKSFRRHYPEQVEATKRMIVGTSANGYLGCCAALRDADLTAAVGSIAVRTLVMTGSHDPVTPPKDGRMLAQQLHDASFVELEAAHLANVEDAEGFNAAILSFLLGGGAPSK